MPTSLATCSAILLVAVATWTTLVNQEVPQPYLDEVFHVPQAQKYCEGSYRSWDPKITTPPGLYIVAASLSRLLGCSTTTLRIENAASLLLLFLILTLLLARLQPKRTSTKTDEQSDQHNAHVALNATLFPPLFFFSALYYTDVLSTLFVLVFHACWRRSYYEVWRQRVGMRSALGRGALLYLLGIWTLLFRQTNIFWVAVFPAALTIIDCLDKGHAVVKVSMHQGTPGFGDSLVSIAKTSWKMRVVYDCEVGVAQVDDYLKTIVSVTTVALRAITDLPQLGQLLIALAPFLGLLTSFVAFLILNGSVVLGDKSNHVATLHLPQMLYIWPYFLFFTWPILLPLVIGAGIAIFQSMPGGSQQSIFKHYSRHAALPRLRYTVVFIFTAALTIRYNTIIHPFTLADNRHYTFYVFRLLMRPAWMRYAVLPIYSFGAWFCIRALATPVDSSARTREQEKDDVQQPPPLVSNDKEVKSTFVMAWLITTALQLITAPLVEPRYFILPWIFWRMNLTQQDMDTAMLRSSRRSWLDTLLMPSYTQRLWLETVWYLMINAATGYIFLNWGFTWLSEPLNIQRFMW